MSPEELAELSNQTLEGKGWSESTSKKMATPVFSLPRNTTDLLQHLQHFQALLMLCFGADSRLARWTSWVHSKIRLNWATFEKVFERYPTGPVYMAAAIDMAVQDVFHLCASDFWHDSKVKTTLQAFCENLEKDVFGKRKIDWSWLPGNIEKMLATNRKGPAGGAALGWTTSNDAHAAGPWASGAGDGGAGEQGIRPAKTRRVTYAELPPPPPGYDRNPTPPPKKQDQAATLPEPWPELQAAATGKGWKKFVAPAALKSIPKIGSKNVCLKYWLQGACTDKCERRATHVGGKPPAGFRDRFHEWAVSVQDGTLEGAQS